MDTVTLRGALLDSLYHILELEAFVTLDDFLQGETLLLRALALAPGPLCPSDLSGALRLSRSRVTAALSALGKKGLVETAPSAEDRRRVEVRITPAGLRVIGEKIARLNRYFDRLVEGLGEEQSRSLIALIDRSVQVMED